MSEPPQQPSDVECLDACELKLREVDAPEVPVEHQRERDLRWAEVMQQNPGAFFDAPVVACVDVRVSAGRAAELAWAVVPYRNFALRYVRGAAPLGSLFVTVLQPVGGGVLVGRMSHQTAAPGRWQLPGGSVEPPQPGGQLDAAALADNASRDLAEETGLSVDPAELRLLMVTRGERGNVGVHWLAPPLAEGVARRRFDAHAVLEKESGRSPELQGITVVGSLSDLESLDHRADYLKAVLGRLPEGVVGA